MENRREIINSGLYYGNYKFKKEPNLGDIWYDPPGHPKGTILYYARGKGWVETQNFNESPSKVKKKGLTPNDIFKFLPDKMIE